MIFSKTFERLNLWTLEPLNLWTMYVPRVYGNEACVSRVWGWHFWDQPLCLHMEARGQESFRAAFVMAEAGTPTGGRCRWNGEVESKSLTKYNDMNELKKCYGQNQTVPRPMNQSWSHFLAYSIDFWRNYKIFLNHFIVFIYMKNPSDIRLIYYYKKTLCYGTYKIPSQIMLFLCNRYVVGKLYVKNWNS